MNKAELRQQYLEKQKMLSEEERHSASSRIADHFFSGFDLAGVRILHATPIHPGRLQLLRAVQHFHTGIRVLVHTGPRGHGGRFQAVPGADCKDSIGIVDLRLLPEFRAGPPLSGSPHNCGSCHARLERERAAAVFLCSDGACF